MNLGGEKGREFIYVAQKFVAVVILMFIFLPSMHLINLAGDTTAFEPDNPVVWFREAMFWIAAASFFLGTGLFVIALIDLAYAMFGLDGTENASPRKCASSDPNEQRNKCGNAGNSASGKP